MKKTTLKNMIALEKQIETSHKESIEMLEAAKYAGYREQFAIIHGKHRTKWINGHKCFVFEYSNNLEYQDANGATYDTVIKSWID